MARRAARNSASPEPLIATTFAARLRDAQSEKRITNEDLARELDVSLRLVQKWRAGTVPGAANLIKLARFFGHDIDWFFTAVEAVA